MLKYKSLKKITALLLSLVLFGSISTGVFAGNDNNASSGLQITNGGGIILNSFSLNDSEITVTGTYSGKRQDRISYVVYEKDNKDNLISIGETKSSNGSFAIVFGVDTTNDPNNLVLETKAKSQTEKAIAEFSLDGPSFNLKEKIEAVKALLDRCEENGIATDYERVKYATAVQVESMLDEYIKNNETEAYEFNTQKVAELLAEAETSLTSYLDGTAQPMKVNRTVSARPAVDGQSFQVKMDDGSVKPAFYVGYGHWETDDIEHYKDLGVNYIQYEVGVNQIIKRACPAKAWELDDMNSSGTAEGFKYTTKYQDGALQLDSNGYGEVYLSQTVSVKPSTTYTFGIDFKCSSASSIWIKANGAQEEKKWIYDSSNDSAIENYKSVSHTVTTGPEQTELTFTIGSHNNAVGLLYDNAFVKESGSDVNLLQNGDFAEECTDKFAVNKDNLDKVKSVFERAEKSDVSVVLLLCTHYFPLFVYDMDSTVANGDPSKFVGFMPFNPTHPLVKEVLTAFINGLVPAVKDYNSLNSICLSNEPAFYANETSAYYLPIYRKYLEDKYTTVEKMNTAYDTTYSSFDDVNMPASTDRTSDERKKITYFNDYRLFNESIMTEYHKNLADAVKAVDNSLLLHTKQMSAMNAIGHSGNRIQAGINNEKLSKFMDLNGCDAWAYYGEEKDPLLAKTMWYDYMTSVKDAPVVNSEDHILKDYRTELTRNDDEYKMNMADLWQGAIHGRGGTVIWLWDKGDRSKGGTSHYNTNITRRADYIAGIGKIALDLNRLSGEITAIQQAKPRVAILYSDSSLTQNPYALNAGYIAYEKAVTYGEKVFFVTEEEPELLNANNDLKLLVVPCSNYMKAETLQEIKTFIDGGGKVLMLNAENKQWLNENGKPHNNAVLQSVIDGSTSASFSKGNDMYTEDTGGEVSAALDAALEALEAKEIELTATNGNIEWQQAPYGQKQVINICNHGNSSVEVTLNVGPMYDAAETVDLITGKKVGGSFVVQPNEPMLLSVKGDNANKFLNENGEAVNKISGNKMSAVVSCYDAEPDKDATHIVAIYEEDCLVKVFTNTSKAGVGGTVKSELKFDIDSSIDLSKCTVKSFLFNSLEGMKPLLPAAEIKQ